MRDERELIEQCGKELPFKVPEGYFERFHEQLISSLPEPKPAIEPSAPISLMARIKPWFYMAAMFAGIIFMVQGLMYVQQNQFPTNDMASIEDIYTEEIDHFMSSSLYNEYVLYSYLTTNDYD